MTVRTMTKAPVDPEAEEKAREEERALLCEKFDVILNRLDAIDRLENVQERLMSRLERVDTQLDALDDKRVECYGGEKARKPIRRLPEQTSVFDMKRGVACLETLNEYYRKNGRPKMPTYTTVYDPKTQSAKLVFWKQYVEGGFEAADLAARKPKPLPDFTAVYDKETKTARLALLEDYLRKHKAPKQDYAAVYDAPSQSVKLIFWKTYLEQYLAADLAARKKPIPHYTTVYNKEKQCAELVTWDKFLRHHKAPPCPVYAAVYDEASKGVKLVFWKQYLEHYLPKDLQARKPKALPEVTCVYDAENKSAKLQLLEDYKRQNPAPWKQAYAAIYDKPSKEVKLLFWKQYVEGGYLAADLASRRLKRAPEYTSVYDPKTKEAKLITWTAYLKTHEAPPVGHYTTIYDPETESCKLVTWRDYLEHHKGREATNLMPKKAKQQQLQLQQQQQQRVATAVAKKSAPEYTAVYDEKTKSVKLQLWDEYIKTNRPTWSQAYAAVYDPETQSVKTVFWRQYKENYLKKDLEARKARKPRLPEQTVVYDQKTKTAKLQLWSEYIKENKPKWRQDYAAIYDSETKSVKLIYWSDYVKNYQPYDIKAREASAKKLSQKGSV